MTQAAMMEEPDTGKKTLKIIHEILDEFTIDRLAAARFEDLVTKGMEKVDIDRGTQARALEAEENFRLLAEHIRNNLQGIKSVVGVEDIENSLSSLCPIYPIC